MGGIRTRLALTLVALVAVTVAAIGIGTYAFVDASLRDRLIADARQQVDFNLSVLLPDAQPRPTDADTFAASGLPAAFRLRGDAEVHRRLRRRRPVLVEPRAPGRAGPRSHRVPPVDRRTAASSDMRGKRFAGGRC